MLAGVEAGNPMARALLEKAPKLEWPYHYHAFGDLSTERQIGMSVGPIPASAIRAYARADGLSAHDMSVLDYVIRRLDNHFLAKTKKQLEKSTAKAGGK